ncbi:hypothetical protein GCM10011321_15030 [Youhaiella tibetensis]|uniref:Uncharacterized protein n=1 Tax=Paradevosia tibetensis TaxID=1447062 RepID=A0A5B9DNV9_9HYPH|nr:hypothetical protein [Youhaiella tibetensis]QEE20389.1 hypothetical protein FNA67_09470 [Youhaiella tibetensis]GGF24614.1 hypothetical protein GCM10011321_15030 [Youhaiella tibetensis]
MTVHPDYAYWAAALEGTFGPVHDGDAQCGFYRRRLYKDGPFVPVAIWRGEDGKLVALVDQRAADAADIWTWVCDKPITEAQYRAVVAGERWHDEPPAPALSNMPTDPFEALKIELAAEHEIAAEYLKAPVTTQDQANQIAVLTKRLSGLKSRATDLHKVEKQPFLDGGRKVDDKWRDLKEEPDTLSKKLKRHLDAYLQEQQRLENERRRKAQEEADRVRRKAEEAARQAAAANDDAARAEAERLEHEAAAKTKEAEARNASAGRTGARVALRTFVSANITDFDALLLALKDRPEIRECVESLANRAAKSGVELPGMTIASEQRAA